MIWPVVACGGELDKGQMAGAETGPCIEGQCLAGLACRSDVCVDAGTNATTGGDGPDPTTGLDATTASDATTATTATTASVDSTASTTAADTGCAGQCGGSDDCLPGQTCEDCTCVGEPRCPDASQTPCLGGCVALEDSFENCGGCGEACPVGADACVDGCCRFDVDAPSAAPCAIVCISRGLECEPGCAGVAIYDSPGCASTTEIALDSCGAMPPESSTCGAGCSCPVSVISCGCR